MPGGRILIIDGDPTVHEHLGRVLEAEGYLVAHSGDGQEALRQIAAEPPEAIVVDFMVPGMDCRTFMSVLRGDLGRSDIAVVVMSAVAQLDPRQMEALGVSDVLEKPVDAERLLNKLALALFRAQQNLPVTFEQVDTAAVAADLTGGPPGGDSDNVVLIIDHDHVMLQHLDDLYSSLGYTVVSLSRVTEELPRVARVLEPHAIVLDLHLPGTDGLTALRCLRAQRALDSIPILIVSSDAEALGRVRGEIAELAAVALSKPLQFEDLVAFVKNPPAAARRQGR